MHPSPNCHSQHRSLTPTHTHSVTHCSLLCSTHCQSHSAPSSQLPAPQRPDDIVSHSLTHSHCQLPRTDCAFIVPSCLGTVGIEITSINGLAVKTTLMPYYAMTARTEIIILSTSTSTNVFDIDHFICTFLFIFCLHVCMFL